MNFRLEKNLKILNEILGYCFKKGCRDFDLSLKFDHDVGDFIFRIDADQISDEDFQYLSECISIDRQIELEESFWELSGESSLSCEDELSLVGVMIDEFVVKRDGKSIIFEIKRFEKKH